MIRQSKSPSEFRLRLVQYSNANGVKAAARTYGTSPHTVRKWRDRWTGKKESLQDQSKAPHRCPHKISGDMEKKIVRLKKELPTWGAERLKRDFELPCSAKSIGRVYRINGLTAGRRKKKHVVKNDLRAVKALWPLFGQSDIDTKHLQDIPQYWPGMTRLGLPKYEYTFREVRSGVTFLGFANELSLSYSHLFAGRILKHLKECGVKLEGTIWQSDNGSEFIGSWHKIELSAFTRILESHHVTHKKIPPGAHTYQADVETFHSLVESEFFEIETFINRDDFFMKANSYQHFFNIARTNSYKGWKTPLDLIRELNTNIDPKIVLLPVMDLDAIFRNQYGLRAPLKKVVGGNDVPSYPYFNFFPPFLFFSSSPYKFFYWKAERLRIKLHHEKEEW